MMSGSLMHTGKLWEDPEATSGNRLPMRSPLLPYPDAGSAMADAIAGPVRRNLSDNPWYLGLDGTWNFMLSPDPGGRPADFYSPGFDDGAWGTLRVPGTWTLQGHDAPHYTNVIMPFSNTPPSVPAIRNPTGLYRVGKMYQYTNRGVGMTPPYIRFNCRPEITVFTLESV